VNLLRTNQTFLAHSHSVVEQLFWLDSEIYRRFARLYVCRCSLLISCSNHQASNIGRRVLFREVLAVELLACDEKSWVPEEKIHVVRGQV
jgi:hypothetical protein